MFKELSNACGTEVPLVEVNSTGSMENVNNLVGNQVNAAFVQSDVLYLRARTEELGNVKTLLALHSEQVHIVTRAASGLKTGGVMRAARVPSLHSVRRPATAARGQTGGAADPQGRSRRLRTNLGLGG